MPNMNSLTMAIHTVLEAASTLLRAGAAPLYLLLTCTSLLFSFLIICRRRRDSAGESSLRWAPGSATSLDVTMSSQSSPQSLKSSSTQPPNMQITQNTTIHRKHSHQHQHSTFFTTSTDNEDDRDITITGESHCNDGLVPAPDWSHETAINQHKIQLKACELLQRGTTDNSHTGEQLHQDIKNASHTGELLQRSITNYSHSGELLQRAITDSSGPSDPHNIHACSHSSHVQEDAVATSGSWCESQAQKQDCGQDSNSVHGKATVNVDHQREIIQASPDDHIRNKYHEAISLSNKAKACIGKSASVETVLTCDQGINKHKHLLQQLSLDSHQSSSCNDAIRSSSTNNIVLACDKYARKLRRRHGDSVRHSEATPYIVNSCKEESVSDENSVHSPADSDPLSMMYTIRDNCCTEKVPGSECTCVSKLVDTENNPVFFSQEITYQQEPVGSEFPRDTYLTSVHSFPRVRTRCRGLPYSSEKRASRNSHRKTNIMVCQCLEEISPQNYDTTVHTTLGNNYSQEPMSTQTSCAIESHSLTDHSMPQHDYRISSTVSNSSPPAAFVYRDPKQRLKNRIFQGMNMAEQDFSDSSPSLDLPNNVPTICSNHGHPQVHPETTTSGHVLGQLQPDPANTSTSLNNQHVQMRRKRWGKSFFIPVERSQSLQMDFMSRPLSFVIPVISHSNDSLGRRKLTTLGDMEQHLSKHTKGIFRKRVSVNNMLTWSKEPIQKPMIRTKNKSIRKDACEIFKMIQVYMGDRKGKLTNISVALDVVTRGWSMPSLRDEIYVQLMRQTTDNKRDESLQCGWELLAMCLYFFPPSVKFHSWLESYISQHQESFSDTDKVPSLEISAHCLRRLKRAQKIATRMAVHKPTLEELEHAKTTISRPTMFGNMLEDIMLLQKDRYPDRQLPWIQTVLSEEILRLHGAQTEGIFRVSGDIDEVNNLKTQCDKWILPTDCTDPHIPASLLKLWYRELYEPLIPAQFYQACVDNYSNAEAAISIVYQLPHLNHLVLCYLIRFLQLFASPGNAAFTKMDVNNLAMVMAPNCLRYESEDLLTIYENVQKEMGFIRTLIRYLDTSFIDGIV